MHLHLIPLGGPASETTLQPSQTDTIAPPETLSVTDDDLAYKTLTSVNIHLLIPAALELIAMAPGVTLQMFEIEYRI